jgi:phosphonopyruvate decarboxylase
MIRPEFLYEQLTEYGVNFFTGVPDSLLKDFCAYITDNITDSNHIIAANEGTAIGLACGHYLSTNSIPLIYMQNSGIGNAVNPLLSLADKKVYSIPLLLLIGWRGEPGVYDEPQHISQGEVLLALLDAMRIPYLFLDKKEENIPSQLENIFRYLLKESAPYALVVKKDTFSSYQLKKVVKINASLSREDAVKIVIEQIESNGIVVSTTGMISRELYELRDQKGQGHSQDFLTVGSMGHASQIGLGIALNKPKRKVYCFDGDGAMLMHLGGLTSIGSRKPVNYIHIIFNNGAHDSVGGQPTVANEIDIQNFAKSLGYAYVDKVDSIDGIVSFFQSLKSLDKGPVMLEIVVKKGARKDLGRPKKSPIENKNTFMEFLNKE